MRFKRILFVINSVLCLGLLAEDTANLSGFDAESIRYAQKERERIDLLLKAPTGGSESEFERYQMLRWLAPFHSDLTPYLVRQKSLGTEKWQVKRLRIYFQKEWLPQGWADDQALNKISEDPIPNDAEGGFRYYQRVPNSIVPVFTFPNGTPVFFSVWEHRTGEVKISALVGPEAKNEILLVAHKDSGFGGGNHTEKDILEICRTYFQIPPQGLVVPSDWTPLLQIDRRDGRFIGGRISGSFSGNWRDSVKVSTDVVQGGSWGNGASVGIKKGRFYFDGFNLVLYVTPVKGGVATDSPMIGVADIDWDVVEKMEKVPR